ncbi:MAG: eL32 family ribosomal protein [Nanoarchaeota archaeon]
MPNKKFLRRNTNEYLKLGKKRKKIQKWRRPRGRDNKMRLKTKGHPSVVKVGYKQNKLHRGKIHGKELKIIRTISDLNEINGKTLQLGKIGRRNKITIAKVAIEKNAKFINFDPEKFVTDNSKENEPLKKVPKDENKHSKTKENENKVGERK